MYRIQVRYGKEWRWGWNEYSTIEEAERRVAELRDVGIKSRIRKNEELFN